MYIECPICKTQFWVDDDEIVTHCINCSFHTNHPELFTEIGEEDATKVLLEEFREEQRLLP